MNLESNTTVRQLAVELPGATRLFEKVGIDYCCGGHSTLADACAKAGVSMEEIMTSLESVSSTVTSEQKEMSQLTLNELIKHIVDTHHVFTTSEIQRLRFLIDKVYGVHLENHPELARLRTLFETLAGELGPHMSKEERVLFPYVIELEHAVNNNRSVPTPFFMTVNNPVRMMMSEHDAAGDILKEMRKLTSDYTPPADGCISFQTLYQALDAFEKDLHQHIHLENNILFPKAITLEKQV